MDAMKDLKSLFLILLILGFVWLFTSGPLRPEAKSGWFLFGSQQKNTTKNKGQTSDISSKKQSAPTETDKISKSSSSAPVDILKINTRRAKEIDYKKEYIEISAPKSNKGAVKLTGVILKNKNETSATIKQGAHMIFPETTTQPEQDIYLNPGEKAIVITGTSQFGVNFQLNKCLGYLNQFHDFEPELPNKCPMIKDENLPGNLNDECLDYIDRIPSCKTFVSAPIKLSLSCQEYINAKINYKNCNETHRYDSDFYIPEWRIYLNRSEELWKKSREIIYLISQNGQIIDSKSY